MNLDTLLKKTARTLYLSARILPTSIRPAFTVAYLLCRYADTIADTHLLPAQRRLYWVQKFPQIVQAEKLEQQAVLLKEITGSSSNPYEKTLLTHLEDCLEELRHIEPDLKPFIVRVVKAVCQGMELDLQRFPQQKKAPAVPLQTRQELEQYCQLMGGEPGLFWSELIAYASPLLLPKEVFFELGQQIGNALQIVNILRDLPRDLRQGRCYFASEELTKVDLTVADLLLTKNSIRFAPIKKEWIGWGRKNLEQAAAYYAAIPKSQWRIRAAVAWPMLWTADTFYKLAQAPDLLNPTRRIKISKKRVYSTMMKSVLFVVSNRYFEKTLMAKLAQLH